MFLGALRRFGRSLLFGFRRELRAYEAAPFEAALRASQQSDSDALRAQFETRERIQRWGKRVLYFSLARDTELPRISALNENYCYASAVLSSPQGKVTAKLMTNRGLLSTLEFSRPPLPTLSEGFTVEKLALHPGGVGYAEEIHEEEHGPRSDA
jgi:hypothetical protein